MADAARRMGWNWLGIADHSPTLQIANGASADDLLEQNKTIKKYNADWEKKVLISDYFVELSPTS